MRGTAHPYQEADIGRQVVHQVLEDRVEGRVPTQVIHNEQQGRACRQPTAQVGAELLPPGWVVLLGWDRDLDTCTEQGFSQVDPELAIPGRSPRTGQPHGYRVRLLGREREH